MTRACALRDGWLNPPDDGEERCFSLTWAGERIDVWATIFGSGSCIDVEVDGISHDALTLTGDDISETMKASLASNVRAILKREEDEAREEA